MKAQKKNKTMVVVLLLLVAFCSNSINLSIKAAEEHEIVNSEILNGSELNILTKHDIRITNEFSSKFLDSDYAINNGITTLTFSNSFTYQGWRALLMDPSKSIDLAWGGKIDTFEAMEKDGLLKHIDNSTLKAIIDSNIPEELAGISMKRNDSSGDYVWISDSISSYGLIVNHEFLSSHNLPVPISWDNLSSPVYYLGSRGKAIYITDPPLSTTHTQICQIILQVLGWEEGWSNLTMIGANAGFYRHFIEDRGTPVTCGEAGVGMVIDFYGVVNKRENPNLEYIIPKNQSMVFPDPIAISTNVDNQAGAEAFIEYLVSLEGQSVWLQAGLDRLPANEKAFQTTYGQTRIDLYELFNETIASNPINYNYTLAKLTREITVMYFHETITGLHSKLRTTWGEMINQFTEGNISEKEFFSYMDQLGESYYTEQEAIDANAVYLSDTELAIEMENNWRNFAKSKYDTIYKSLTSTSIETTEAISFVFLNLVLIFIASIIRKKRKKQLI